MNYNTILYGGVSKIKVVGSDGKAVFDQSKALLMKKSSNKISIAFNKLTRGNYHIMVELKDLLTGESCSGNKKVSIL